MAAAFSDRRRLVALRGDEPALRAPEVEPVGFASDDGDSVRAADAVVLRSR